MNFIQLEKWNNLFFNAAEKQNGEDKSIKKMNLTFSYCLLDCKLVLKFVPETKCSKHTLKKFDWLIKMVLIPSTSVNFSSNASYLIAQEKNKKKLLAN